MLTSITGILKNLLVPEPQQQKRVRVLIVEDEPEVRALWTETLSATYDVCGASTQTEAIAEMNSTPAPQILILDMRLTDGSGSTPLNYWMKNNGGPCCVISGYLENDDIKQFYQRGVYHVFQKPLDLAIFSSVIAIYRRIIETDISLKEIRLEMVQIKRLLFVVIVCLIVVVSGGEISQLWQLLN